MSVLLTFARWCCKIIVPASLAATAALAQTQAPSAPNTTTEGMQRSQRQSDNVYRWIKMFAEPARKPEAAKAEAPPKPRPAKETAASAPAPADSRSAASPATQPPVAQEPASSGPSAATAPASPPPETSAVARDGVGAGTSAQATPEVEEDDELKIITQAQPEIPRELRNSQGPAKVMVAFTVQPDGGVREPSVISSSHRRLNRPTLDAVSQWKFAPIRSARAVKVELEFDLQ